MSTHQVALAPLSPEAAEPAAKAILDTTKAQMGMVPNMYGAMANLPVLLDSYVHGYGLFRAGAGFTPVEQEVVFLTLSRENGCHYCVAAHSFVADHLSHVPPAHTDAIRDGNEIGDRKLAALAVMTRTMFTTRGRPEPDDVAAFLAAGYTEHHLLAIVLAISVKTISNYTNHLFGTELDPMFAGRAWT
ncbi:MAG: alkylhydroperoxidase AhpD core [Acidimicrobiaceae bacterium]|nr:MAG: alkylhydroperoxidase AhpD core [Acidimicrobiaceae bacterium]